MNNNQINNICVYGIGGVGGYFGGKIAYKINMDAKNNTAVHFIARGQHLQEIQKNGLILNITDQDTLHCIPTMATDDISQIPAPDICLLCVKSYHLDNAVAALSRNIKENTVIIPLLNGVDIYEKIRSKLSRGIILPACLYVVSALERPGIVRQNGKIAKIITGKDPQYPDFRPDKLVSFFQQMDIEFSYLDNPYPAIWEKYLFIAPLNLVNAASGRTLGDVLQTPKLKDLFTGLMKEITSIAEKMGVEMPEAIIESSMQKAYSFPQDLRTSYQKDIALKNKDNEGDIFGPSILRLGKELGVPTPLTEYLLEEINKNQQHC